MAGQYGFLFLGLSLVAFLASPMESSPTPPSCSRVSAAFYWDYNMYFIIGDTVVGLDDNNELVDEAGVNSLQFNGPITAAFGLDDLFYLVSRFWDEGFNAFGSSASKSFIAYADLNRAFADDADFDGIIGAAVYNEDDETVDVFSGCHYVQLPEGDPTNVSPLYNNADIGLPCDIDAILYAPVAGANLAIKGNNVFVFDQETGKFVGPIPYDAYLWGLSQFNLCPN